MKHDIGYMQVQIRLYQNGELYDSFALNGFDEKFSVSTDLICTEHYIMDDPAITGGKVLPLIIKVFEDNSTIAMLIPVHQSEKWEVIKPMDKYTVGFYCVLGEKGKALKQISPNKGHQN